MTFRTPARAWAGLLGLLALLLSACPEPLGEVEKHRRDGNRLFEAGSYAEAEEAFREVVERSPDSPGDRMNLGNARMMLGRTEEALAAYDAALDLDPTFGKAYANRGILKDRLGDARGAMADYRAALRHEPALAEGPSLWQRVLRNPPTETIADRLRYLEAVHGAVPEAAPGEER